MSKSAAELAAENGIGFAALTSVILKNTNYASNLAIGVGTAYAYQYLSPDSASVTSDPMLGFGVTYALLNFFPSYTSDERMIASGVGAGLAYYARNVIDKYIHF